MFFGLVSSDMSQWAVGDYFIVIGLFAVIQLINVMLNTVKSVWTVKASPLKASLINAITFGFYTIVVQTTAQCSLLITVPVTIITNLIGVWCSLKLLEKFKKDTIWRITTSVKKEDLDSLVSDLQKENIAYAVYENKSKNEYEILDIFSYNREESKQTKTLLVKYNAKYILSSNDNKL